MPVVRRTIDSDEIAKFTAVAKEWWDEEGKFAPLHKLNPVRIGYIRDWTVKHFRNHVSGVKNRDSQLSIRSLEAKPLTGLNILDIGCGGGLLSEPLARLGANITAIDAGEKNIEIAKLHAQKEGLQIDYRCCAAEELGIRNQKPVTRKAKLKTQDSTLFDIVLAMEIIEHVADVEQFLATCSQLVKPGGLLFIATLNRTVKSFAFAIVGAEYILRWLPRGTHDWKHFLKPSEIEKHLRANGMALKDLTGVTYNPLEGKFALSRGVGVNYMLLAEKN